MWDLIVFAVIGLLAGAAARLLYPGREPMKIIGTMLLGLGGSMIGGLISWTMWPAVNGQLSFGAFLTSLLGAVFVLAVWAIVIFARRDKVARNL